jgi:hypothetical protein
MERLIAIFLVCVIVFGLSSVVRADVITFEGDIAGFKSNGFQSVDSSLVSFFDSKEENLYINNFGAASDGQGLAVLYDDNGYLIMSFSVPANSLSLDFGNDDPQFAVPGDEAILTAYMHDVFVTESRVVMNCDDIMNQTISISGVVFDKATFFCEGSIYNGLAEVVDNIQFVPEPATICLLGLGGLLFVRNRKFTKK